MKKFKTRLTARGPKGAWTFLEMPFSVEKEFGTKARVAVTGTMNGFAFQNSLMPNGDGTHSMMVSRALQAGAKATAGDIVTVAIDVDRSERVVDVPLELTRALSTNKAADAAFKAFLILIARSMPIGLPLQSGRRRVSVVPRRQLPW